MTELKQGNQALRDRRYIDAIEHYVRILQAGASLPLSLQTSIVINLRIAGQHYQEQRTKATPLRVAVASAGLSHNPAGRAYTLAQLYSRFADVNIIGCLFPQWGREIWEPIRATTIPKHTFVVEDQAQFIDQAFALVCAHPYDIVHLSKPRLPNIVFGMLYKLIWNATVLMDVDDEELAFVKAPTPLAWEAWLKESQTALPLNDWLGQTATRLAVGWANGFDGVTVSNPALQQRYGGTILRHARDEADFKPSVERRHRARSALGLTAEQKVVLFLGTPRAHKGLQETAQAIASLPRQDVVLLIVGDFPKGLRALKTEIAALPGVKTRFMGNQPFASVPDLLAAGDVCVLLQDPDSLAAQFQTPAKLTDALAMGLVVLAEVTPGLADLAEAGAFEPVTRTTLAATLATVLDQLPATPAAHPVFTEQLSLAANYPVLQTVLARTTAAPLSAPLHALASHTAWGLVLPTLVGTQICRCD